MRRSLLSRWLWVVLPVAGLLAGCTTIHTVSGGAKAGEFYVMITKNLGKFNLV